MPAPQTTASAEQQRRDEYMQIFSDTFSDELVELYELDGSTDAVEHLRACIEAGVDVWGQPLQIPDPTR